jgi:hypothetical protein
VSVKSSREPVSAMWSSTKGMTRVPTTIVKPTSAATFSAVTASAHHDARLRSGIGKEDGQQHDRQYGEQILDDEPSDGDMSVGV